MSHGMKPLSTMKDWGENQANDVVFFTNHENLENRRRNQKMRRRTVEDPTVRVMIAVGVVAVRVVMSMDGRVSRDIKGIKRRRGGRRLQGPRNKPFQIFRDIMPEVEDLFILMLILLCVCVSI